MLANDLRRWCNMAPHLKHNIVLAAVMFAAKCHHHHVSILHSPAVGFYFFNSIEVFEGNILSDTSQSNQVFEQPLLR